MEWGLKHISSIEIAEWLAEYSIEPFGDVRGDLHAAIVASTIANVNRDTSKQRDPFSPIDFMPKFEVTEPVKPRQTWQQQLALAEALNAAYGGQDLRKKDGNTDDTGSSSNLGE